MANRAFGTQTVSQITDTELRTGWGKRAYNWEFSTGVQHEIAPRVSVDLSFLRRWYGNFAVTDDLNLAPSDLDEFSMTVPVDSRLPGGGGNTIRGLYNRTPASFGRPANNTTRLSDNYGKQIEHWQGVDASLQARLRSGVLVQGGLSSGKTTTDNCEIVAKLPEMLTGNRTQVLGVDPGAAVWLPASSCHQESPYLTQFKALGAYTIPRIDIQVSGTLQSIPGPALLANYNLPTAAAATTLGRPLSGGAANMTVSVIEPGAMYGERLNQIDLRIAKVFRAGQRRAMIGFDLYNLTNSATVLTVNNNYGTLWRPTSVLQARFVKISAQIDY